MYLRQYEWYIRHLTAHIRMQPQDVVFVKNIAVWCREHGLRESDEQTPIKLVSGNGAGAQILVAEEVPDGIIEERINALRMRSQIKSLGYDQADLLNSEAKKLGYLFLKEYSSRIPHLAYDDIASDEWVFEQMARMGVLTP